MKYNAFKIFKFSTIAKKINRTIDNFSKNLRYIKRFPFKLINFFEYCTKSILSAIIRVNKIIVNNSLKTLNIINLKKIDYTKFYKFLYISNYNFYKFNKRINFSNYKYIPVYFITFFIFLIFVYLAVPLFYNYNKLIIQKNICKNYKVECLIRGKISYAFYPNPRIKIKDFVIKDSSQKKNTLLTAKDASIKLSIKNLLNKQKQKFNKIEINNFEAKVDIKNLKKYIKIIEKKNNSIPIKFKKGNIVFFDKKNYVASIDNANIAIELNDDLEKYVLKGKFLNDTLYLNLNNKIDNNNLSSDIIFKMSNLNLLTKANLYNPEDEKNKISGNILIKKNKHRLTGVFDYKDNKINIKKSNLNNIFLDGNLEGKIKFLPYFNFDLDLSLNSLNFTKLYNYFLSMDKNEQKNLFKTSNKINGKISLSSDKIYSSYNLVESFESRIKFNNGNILIEQFLINLGKLGAADILGEISNEKKFTNFKYESNIFVDNEKKFISKLGIYNKKNIPSNLFISGNFDFQNIKKSFYEISDNEKLSENDINFIENEFNNILLTEGYNNLFRFPKFKQFIKSITEESN